MLGALGCNPSAKGQSIDDIGGFTLGQMAFSPDGGIYVAVRAGEAIAQYACCAIGANMDIVEADNGTNAGLPLCFPQVALVNDDYAWALVCGIARGKSDGGVAAGSNVLLDATSGELDTAAVGTTAELVHGVVMLQNDGSNDGPIFAMFPSKSTG